MSNHRAPRKATRKPTTTSGRRKKAPSRTRVALTAAAAVTTTTAAITGGLLWLNPSNGPQPMAATSTPDPTPTVVETPVLPPPDMASDPELTSRFASVSRTLDRSPSPLDDVPDVALAAYQRAETVINSSTKACNLDWFVLAGVGAVESDHGRDGGSTLDQDGIAKPAVYGRSLNGKKGFSEIADTDAGRVDGDKVWDRAAGPMQILPSVWSLIAVDSDGDGQRNPQDIDDASLAVAVHLCSASADLSKSKDAKKALSAFNGATGYASQVLAVAATYRTEFDKATEATTPEVIELPDAPEPSDLPSEDPATPSSEPSPDKPTKTPKPPKPTPTPEPPKPPKPTPTPSPTPTKPPQPEPTEEPVASEGS